MISQDDIDAMADDLETADRIIKRAEEGRKIERLFHANEIMPFLRAYVVMRNTAQDAANFMTAQKQREKDAMRLHTKDSKYSD